MSQNTFPAFEFKLSIAQTRVCLAATRLFNSLEGGRLAVLNELAGSGFLRQGSGFSWSPIPRESAGTALTLEQQKELAVRVDTISALLGYVPGTAVDRADSAVAHLANLLELALEGMADDGSGEAHGQKRPLHASWSNSTATLTITPYHAKNLVQALEAHTRLGIGQLQYVEELMRENVIPLGPNYQAPPRIRDAHERAEWSVAEDQARSQGDLPFEVWDAAARLFNEVKTLTGYHPHSSWGIGAKKVDKAVGVGYEVEKVLKRELALLRDPNPSFRGVDYDGVGPRYSEEVLPVVKRTLWAE